MLYGDLLVHAWAGLALSVRSDLDLAMRIALQRLQTGGRLTPVVMHGSSAVQAHIRRGADDRRGRDHDHDS
jgi:hypothetical protein